MCWVYYRTSDCDDKVIHEDKYGLSIVHDSTYNNGVLTQLGINFAIANLSATVGLGHDKSHDLTLIKTMG